MRIKRLMLIIGIFFILTGFAVPSNKLIEFLLSTHADLLKQNNPLFTEKLLLGAAFFRSGLVIIGVLVMASWKIFMGKPGNQSIIPDSTKDNKSSFIIITILLLIASALRLYSLDTQLWYDEMLTYDKFMHMPLGEIISVYVSDNNHILYTLLARASFWIFGESTWSLRLPAVFFGIGSIWALYHLGRTVSTARVGFFSAALLAFSYHHIWFSQNARGYTALLFWTILTSWLLLRGLRERKRYVWLLYAIASALGAYTHVTMLFVVLGHFVIYLFLMISLRNDIWQIKWYGFFLGFVLAGFLTLQLHALMLPQMIKVFTFSKQNIQTMVTKSISDVSQKSGLTAWKNPIWTLNEFVKGMEMSFLGNLHFIAAFILFGLGLLHFKHKDPIMIMLLILPMLIASLVVIVGGYPLFPRFYFFTLGFLVLILVQGTMKLGDMICQKTNIKYLKSFPIGTALCVLLIFSSAISVPAVYAPKQDYLGARAYVKEMSQSGDAIVTVGLTRFPYRQFYNEKWRAVENIEELNSIRSQVKRTWLLYTLPLPLKAESPQIMNSITREFNVLKVFPGTLNGGTIFVCLSDTPPSPTKTFSTKAYSSQLVPRYSVFELSLKHSGIYQNNFIDVSIDADFTSPSGIQHDVKGFYYKDDVWKVRFSPNEIGQWTYRYVMSARGGFRKEGKGFFKCKESDYNGPVHTNPKNPYRWVFPDGRPYFPVGLQDCIYTDGAKLQGIAIDGIKIIDKVKRVSMIDKAKLLSVDEFFFLFGQAGFNLFRFSQRNCSYSLYDDLDHFREDESIATDKLLALARKHGFRVMFGFFGYHGQWPDGKTAEAIMAPNDYETVAKEKRFMDYSIARWGVYVDFWELLNEREATDKWTSMMVDYVRSVDPNTKSISTNYIKPLLTEIDINSPHWYDFESIFQSDLRVKNLAGLWKQAGKPVIVGEHGNLGSNWGPLSGDRMRIRTWTALFQEISFIFWHTGIWYKADTAANIYLGPEERQYIRVLQDFSSKLDAEVRMFPVEVSSKNVRAYGLISDTVAAAYLHHFENHNSLINHLKITINIPDSDLLNDEYTGEWIDPSTGDVLTSIKIAPGYKTLDVPAFYIDTALIVTYQGN